MKTNQKNSYPKRFIQESLKHIKNNDQTQHHLRHNLPLNLKIFNPTSGEFPRCFSFRLLLSYHKYCLISFVCLEKTSFYYHQVMWILVYSYTVDMNVFSSLKIVFTFINLDDFNRVCPKCGKDDLHLESDNSFSRVAFPSVARKKNAEKLF